MQPKPEKALRTLGRHAKVIFVESDGRKIKAKVDTGADSSAVWASDIRIDEKDRLHFKLFDSSSPYYTGKDIVKSSYRIKMIRSSTGHEQIRYSVKLRIVIDGWKFLASFTLADRSRNAFPVLIGCKLLKSKFVVDVSRGIVEDVHKATSTSLTELSNQNPQLFFEKYYKPQAHTVNKEDL